MTDLAPFDPAGALPEGRVVLEASAGTGKTWSIAALVTRYVAEAGIPIEEILVVTFTRAATSELRDRVRSRISTTARVLTSAGTGEPFDDPVLAHLAAADEVTRSVYVERLQRALANFDRATISTLHGFASRILRRLGLLSTVSDGLALSPDHGDRLAETLSDLMVARFADRTDTPISMRDFAGIAAAVLTNPDAVIIPDAAAPPEAVVRAELAAELRAELPRRSERAGELTYDDLLLRVREALLRPGLGPLAARVVGDNYRVALIDEFQDTDRIQWEIAEELFSRVDRSLVVIGDPKQAIYSFRGADVDAYLDAVANAGDQRTLSTNWRSDGPLLSAFDALLDGVAFGDPRILYLTVSPAPGHEVSRIEGITAPFLVRHVGREAPVRTNRDGSFSAPAARAFIAEDAAEYVSTLLSGDVRIEGREVQPGDIAVLCRTQAQVQMVRAELAVRDVPAVVGRTGSVLTSPAAGEWLTLLAALEYPSSTRRARMAALTPFVGWTPQQLISASDDELLPLHDRYSSWARILQRRGVPGLIDAIEHTTGMTGRVLAKPDGERTATDLAHIAELLHGAHRGGGVRSLAGWLTAEIQDAKDRPEEAETRARRLETDADAVQVLTIHASKGLEFPIVLCPYLWDPFTQTPDVPVFHRSDHGGRAVDVGGKGNWDDFADNQKTAVEEAAQEDLRLMYVALTRARHHVAVWWAPVQKARSAPVTRILYGRGEDGALEPRVALLSDERLLARLQDIIDQSRGTIAVDAVTAAVPTTVWVAGESAPPLLAAAHLDRPIDRSWRRTSFSGLTAGAHGTPAIEDDEPAKDDEPDDEPDAAPPVETDMPWGSLPAGMRFGTLVHEVFEDLRAAGASAKDELPAIVDRRARRSGLDVDPAMLVEAIELTLDTPLGVAGSINLLDIPLVDQLAEMTFELPVAIRAGSVSTADLADLLGEHLGGDHPLDGYSDRLRRMSGERSRGYLTGAIDVVARFGDPARYWVMDYKTNRLDWPEPDIGAYAPSGLAAAMVNGDYALQALIYQVALHRYLRQRMPGYDPRSHLGGAMWLFVRGMVGPDTPATPDGRYGVFRWDAPAALIEAVSDLFDTGGPA